MGFGIGILIIRANLYGGVYTLMILKRNTKTFVLLISVIFTKMVFLKFSSPFLLHLLKLKEKIFLKEY